MMLITGVFLFVAGAIAYFYRGTLANLPKLFTRTMYRPLWANEGDLVHPEASQMTEGVEAARPNNV